MRARLNFCLSACACACNRAKGDPAKGRGEGGKGDGGRLDPRWRIYERPKQAANPGPLAVPASASFCFVFRP